MTITPAFIGNVQLLKFLILNTRWRFHGYSRVGNWVVRALEYLDDVSFGTLVLGNASFTILEISWVS